MWVSAAASASSSSSSTFFCAPVDCLTGIISLGCPGDLRDIFPGKSSLNQRETSSLMCSPAPQEGSQLKGVRVRRMFKGKEMLKRNCLWEWTNAAFPFRQKWLVEQSVRSSAFLWESRICYSAAFAGGRLEIFSEQNNVQINEWLLHLTIFCMFYYSMDGLFKNIFTNIWWTHSACMGTLHYEEAAGFFFSFYFTLDDA